MTRDLIESDAWRTAGRATRMFVERLLVEHMAHAGTENGRLICTFDDLTKFGISRGLIVKAQKDAIKRGLVYMSEKGARNRGAGRWPHRFGLGWLAGHDGSAAPNRWKGYSVAKPHAPTQDIYSSTESGTELNGANPTTAPKAKGNKVPKPVLGKVPEPVLGEMDFGAEMLALITYDSVKAMPLPLRSLFH